MRRTRNRGVELTAIVATFALLASLALAAIASQPTTIRAQGDEAPGPGDPPGGLPRRVFVEDIAYLYDRLVPIDPSDLQAIGEDDGLTLYAVAGDPPYSRVYAAGEDIPDDQIGRYLPVRLADEDEACPADSAAFSGFSLNDAQYAPAGIEPDVTTEVLFEIGTASTADGDLPLYSDSQEAPFVELFVSIESQLQRFILIQDGVPVVLAGELPLGDQTFAFSEDVTDSVDQSALTKLGCAGLYPVFVAEDTEPPFDELLFGVGDRVLRFLPVEQPEEAPTEETTEEATEAPTEEPEPTEEPAPTEEDAEATAEEETTPEEATEEPTDEGEDPATAEPEGEPTAVVIPEGMPREVTIEGELFALDRAVPLNRQDLERVGREGPALLYARTAEPPFAAVYGNVPPRSTSALGRFLPENLSDPSVPCAADVTTIGNLALGETLYAFAGYEPDLTLDNLVQVLDAGGAPVYAESTAEPFAELFMEDETGLQRFVVLSADGRPATAVESLVFAGQEFAFVGDATASVDPGALSKLGCAAAFPVYAEAAGEPPFGVVYFLIGGAYLQFDSGEGPPPTEEASPEPTEQPTEAPTDVPTETPLPTETALPTEEPTEVPTDVPTEIPTETPIPTDTPAPTDTPVPTEAPPPPDTPAPTLEPAESPTDVPPTEVPPTEVPPTEVPPTETVAPDQPTSTTEPAEPTPTEQLQPPAMIPTLAPNVPSPAAATAPVVSIVCTGGGGALDVQGLPERLPKQIQYQGVAYSFDAAVDPDDAGTLTRLGCAGPFVVYSTDQAPREEVLYLQDEGDTSRAFRFEASRTFVVQVEVNEQPRVVQTGETRYELVDRYQRSVYSSVTAILFVENAEDPEPDFVYALRVDADVIGLYEPESESLQEATDAVAQAAQQAYINTDLILNGRRYVLTAIMTPQGTTTNGFVTLYAIPDQETPELYLGVDPRQPELLVYRRSAVSGG